MCEFCSDTGRCIVCGHDHSQPNRLAALRARAHERDIAETKERLARLLADLPGVLIAAGRRPGDGSDQESLFACEPANLFAEVGHG